MSQALSNLLPVPAPQSQAEKIFFDVVYKEFGERHTPSTTQGQDSGSTTTSTSSHPWYTALEGSFR